MIKIRCDKCNYEFSIFEKKCPHCGDTVKITSKFYCTECGNEIDIYKKECSYCNKIPEEVEIISKSGKIISTPFETSEEVRLYDNENESEEIENQKEETKVSLLNNSQNEELENIYIGKNYESIRNNSFSVGLFFLGVFYVFYKKVYSWGYFWLSIIVVSILLNLFILPSYFLSIYISFFGRRIYLDYVRKKVIKIQEDNPDKSFEELKSICKEQGGNSFLSLIICLLIILLAVTIRVAIELRYY